LIFSIVLCFFFLENWGNRTNFSNWFDLPLMLHSCVCVSVCVSVLFNIFSTVTLSILKSKILIILDLLVHFINYLRKVSVILQVLLSVLTYHTIWIFNDCPCLTKVVKLLHIASFLYRHSLYRYTADSCLINRTSYNRLLHLHWSVVF